MKTLSESQKERADQEQLERSAELTSRLLKLSEITTKNIPVFVPKDTRDKNDYTKAVERTRGLVRDRHGRWFGVACDHCKTELWCDGDCLLSMPPQTTVRCPGCGWQGYAIR